MVKTPVSSGQGKGGTVLEDGLGGVHTNPMKAAAVLLGLLAGITPVLANDQDELADFVGGVYRKPGAYSLTKNAALSANGSVWKNGNNYFTPDGCYRRVGNAYFRPDGESVWFTGNTYIAPEGGVAKSGNAIYGSTGAAISTGNSVTVIGDGEENSDISEPSGSLVAEFKKPRLAGYVVIEPELAGYEIIEPEAGGQGAKKVKLRKP